MIKYHIQLFPISLQFKYYAAVLCFVAYTAHEKIVGEIFANSLKKLRLSHYYQWMVVT